VDAPYTTVHGSASVTQRIELLICAYVNLGDVGKGTNVPKSATGCNQPGTLHECDLCSSVTTCEPVPHGSRCLWATFLVEHSRGTESEAATRGHALDMLVPFAECPFGKHQLSSTGAAHIRYIVAYYCL
jgi:hypothetical protein